MASLRVRVIRLGQICTKGYRDVAQKWERTSRGGHLPRTCSKGFMPRLPDGNDAAAIDEGPPNAPSRQEAVTFFTWQWTAVAVDGHRSGGFAARVNVLLASPSVTVTRARKGIQVTGDIRDTILDLGVVGRAEADPANDVRLQAELATPPCGPRPFGATAGLDADLEARDPRRLYQWISRHGARWEPLAGPPATTDAPHALERAS